MSITESFRTANEELDRFLPKMREAVELHNRLKEAVLEVNDSGGSPGGASSVQVTAVIPDEATPGDEAIVRAVNEGFKELGKKLEGSGQGAAQNFAEGGI